MDYDGHISSGWSTAASCRLRPWQKKRVHFLFQQKLASSSSYCQETKGSAAAALCSEEDFINQASFEAPLPSKKRCYAGQFRPLVSPFQLSTSPLLFLFPRNSIITFCKVSDALFTTQFVFTLKAFRLDKYEYEWMTFPYVDTFTEYSVVINV